MEEICVNRVCNFNAKGEKPANKNIKQETKILRNIGVNGKTKPSMALISNNRERRDEHRIIAKIRSHIKSISFQCRWMITRFNLSLYFMNHICI